MTNNPATSTMYAEICAWSNLRLAYARAAKGKRGNGSVAAFEHRLEDNLIELQDELLAQRYQPGKYHSFYIHEPKRRLISAAPFRDRVVHHALCNVIEPIFERSFVADSYANRVGKGTHRALDRAQHLLRTHRYVLQCDVRQFFPSIDHAILTGILARKLPDDGTLGLVNKILAGGAHVLGEEYDMVYFPGDDLFAVNRPRGLPIGNLTSQFWANCYLNSFDHFVKRELRCPGYVRYVDDFLLFADEKRTLWAWLEEVQARLASLRLTLHPGTHPRPSCEGVPFLGFVVTPERRRLKRRKGIHYRRKLRGLIAAYQAKRLVRSAIDASVRGWVNHVRYGNTVGLRKAVLRVAVVRRPVRSHAWPGVSERGKGCAGSALAGSALCAWGRTLDGWCGEAPYRPVPTPLVGGGCARLRARRQGQAERAGRLLRGGHPRRERIPPYEDGARRM